MSSEIKIGFEIHVTLNTKSKLFCQCSADYQDKEPNTNVCPICTGQPGAKPMAVNKKAVELAYLVAKVFNCKKINKNIEFLRKHYFYPDLPNNYQRTSLPVGENGEFMGVRIRELHIEEDPGQYLLKDGLVDYNRSGSPLIEIVTEPDIHSIEQAEKFLRDLKFLLEYLKIIKYGIKVDVNVSIEGGQRVEIKNVNSIENIVRALRFEIARQKRLLEYGEEIKRETRHFDENRGITVSLRSKETAEDYRYIRDPDLPVFDCEDILKQVKVPELPWERIEKMCQKYKIVEDLARTLIMNEKLCKYFESFGEHKRSAEWIQILLGELNYRNIEFEDIENKLDIIEKIRNKYFEDAIPKHYAIDLLRKVLDGHNVEIEDTKFELTEEFIKEICEENKKAVNDYLRGKKEALQFLVGRVIAKSNKRAEPKEVIKMLKEYLDKLK